MKNITVRLMKKQDEDNLLRFETENRAFFEEGLPSRGDAYYKAEVFSGIMDSLLSEQARGETAMYVLLDAAGEIVGRINLADITRGPLQKAELGYRMGKASQGKGYATQGVAAVIKAAKELKLHRLEAGTSPENIGSQRVLEKNGFRQVGYYQQYIRKGENWLDALLYEKILDEK